MNGCGYVPTKLHLQKQWAGQSLVRITLTLEERLNWGWDRIHDGISGVTCRVLLPAQSACSLEGCSAYIIALSDVILTRGFQGLCFISK